jgi:hypothetical protein
MGIVCFVSPISEAALQVLLKRPNLLRPLVDADGDVPRLVRARRDDPLLQEALAEAGISADQWCYGPEAALEKKWAGIHFLLTGEYGDLVDGPAAEPLAALLFGHHQLYEADELPPPSRFCTPEEVEACWQALEPITTKHLSDRYDAERMGGVYPHRWREGLEGFSYLADAYDALRELYAQAARNGHGVLIRWAT